MDVKDQETRLKILSGPIPELEIQLNALLDEWGVIVWQFVPIKNEIHGVAVLLHQSIIRRQAIANVVSRGEEIGGFPYARR